MKNSWTLYLCIFLFAITCFLFYFLLAEYRIEKSIDKEYIRFDFKQKKAFESICSKRPCKVILFHIPEFEQELLPFFDPANLIKLCKRRSQFDSGLHVMGMNIRTGKLVAVDNFPFLSFYQWSWNQRVQTSRHLYSHHWISFHNHQFLGDSHDGSIELRAVMQATMDPIFMPQTLSPSTLLSEHDMIIVSHRASSKTIPYFMHFKSRRVLTCAFGSMRLSFLPWVDARRYVTPENCVLKYNSGKASSEWMLSPKCNLKQLVRFGGFTVHQGQSVVIPPFMVYHVEHILPGNKREKFEQCCIVLQADYQTCSNRIKNWISFKEHKNHEVNINEEVSSLSDENELQNEDYKAHARPNATFMKPEMNTPMKEERKLMEETEKEDEEESVPEWMADIVNVKNVSNLSDIPSNLFDRAIYKPSENISVTNESTLVEAQSDHHSFPETTNLSAIINL